MCIVEQGTVWKSVTSLYPIYILYCMCLCVNLHSAQHTHNNTIACCAYPKFNARPPDTALWQPTLSLPFPLHTHTITHLPISFI